MYWIFSLLFFSIISSPIIEVMIKETSWTNIGDSVQIFEYLNKLPSKSPLYKANEFQVRFYIYGSGSLESFCRFFCALSHFIDELDCILQVGSDKGLEEWENEF